MLTGLAKLLTDTPQLRELVERLRDGQEEGVSILEAAKPFLLGTLWQQLRVPVLVVCPRPDDARRLYDALLAYWGRDSSIHHFSELEALPFERLTPDTTTVYQRLRALTALADVYEGQEPALVVTSASGLTMKSFGPELLAREFHTVHKGESMSMDTLLGRWVSLGYRIERAVEVPGTMSRRGGILDIFAAGELLPVRLEFWGDVVESMRTFDPGTQRALEQVERVSVIPAREVLPTRVDPKLLATKLRGLDFAAVSPSSRARIEEELALLAQGQEVEEAGFYAGFFNEASIGDFLPTGGLLVVNQATEVEEALRELDRRSWELRQVKSERSEIPGGFPSPYLDQDEATQRLHRASRRLSLTRWDEEGSATLPFHSVPSFWSQLDGFLEEVRQRIRKGDRVVVMTNHARRLQELMEEQELSPRLEEQLAEPPAPGSITLIQGSLAQGWSLEATAGGAALFADAEVFGTTKIARPRRLHTMPREAFLAEITPGAYVVHVDHGVARFAGTTTVQEDDQDREYLVLEYSEEDRLYVPTEHLNRVSLYVAPGDRPPSLTRLGTQEWSRIKERVKRSVLDMADELLAVHAARETVQGISFGRDVPWQQEMEDAFPYVETPDQSMAIARVKEDMERPRPMDRLVCGDVGYGKTEVALRAAFKAVMEGNQVAVLVPTTVLAQQHYATFTERLSPFPVNVEVLSRFRTDQEQRQVVEALAEGKVDICIGTHRLLQKDVSFKNLGLVVVDEEQRFGVGHKERLKQLRKEVDVLTLSATPIPRTLHMALSGIRDMSTMETPPEERLPIKTYVSEYSDELVREAVLRELDRGGQVYLVHNRVHNIARMADTVAKLVPEASVAIGHGRMSEEALERVMTGFARGEADVLVCTTIIESGLDLPNVNTLIINRADALGLSQLYQLRGRIGRGAHRAYAYLLVPRGRRITEASQKRLETILAATELGAGFRIAMKDLEIRGAGNILGAQQSGNIHSVGYELYSQLLTQAVEQVKASGDATSPATTLEERPDVTLSLQIPARIPPDYVEDLPTRLGLYQRLGRAREVEEIGQVQEELRDRFGPVPREAHNLLYSVRVRVLAERAGMEAVTREAREGGEVTVRLRDDVGGAKLALAKVFSDAGLPVRVGNRLLHLQSGNLKKPWGQALLELLEGVIAFRERMVEVAG